MKRLLSILLTVTLVLLLAACGGQSTDISSESVQQATSLTPLANATEQGTVPFSDIPANADYAQAVSWCYEQGLMDGVGENHFDPEGTLTRAMLSTVLYRAAGTPAVSGELSFTDAQPGAWYSDAVVWADGQGYMKGYGDGLFGTNDPVSVEQLEIIFERYIGNDPEWTGDPAKAHAATRAQVAVALYENLKDTATIGGKVLVAYFSRTGENYGVGVIEKGNTEIVAEMIASGTNADLFAIETVKEYPEGYEDCKTVVQQERAENARPELKSTVNNFEQYGTIFLGYPIWYSDMPMAVYTFLGSYDFTGKTVIPFCTHAGSGLSGTINSIKNAVPNANVLDGLAIAGTTAQDDRATTQSSVDTFIDSLDISHSSGDIPTVYMTTSISPEGLMKVYDSLNWTPAGKVAVKLSTGEPPASNYLDPNLIKDVVEKVNGTIVECNTAYGGQRASTAMHYQVAKDHGFTDIADFQILDENGSMALPVEGGSVLTENYVGAAFGDYDSYLVLSHFKGHAMAGFGGAIKNISIGLGSSEGKSWIHSGGTSRTSPWGGDQDAFLESMGEAGKSVVDALDGQIVYVNVMNRLSVDCDCDGNPAEPDMHDIGILASADPVALDQACIDLIYEQKDGDGASLVNRIESRNGLHTLEHAQEIGLGSREYSLVSIDS